MAPFEGETYGSMVIRDCFPCGNVVAMAASVGLHILGDPFAVRIIMACVAFGGFKRELWLGRSAFVDNFLMACNAGDCQVAAFKGIFGLLMILDRERRWRKALYRMALRAFPPGFTTRKLPAMKIGMAVHASSEFQAGQGFPFFMAFFAGHRRVFSLQRESRFRMIEIGAVNVSPAGGIMAGFTGLFEFSAMYILMAIGTTVMLDTGEFYVNRFRRFFRI